MDVALVDCYSYVTSVQAHHQLYQDLLSLAAETDRRPDESRLFRGSSVGASDASGG